MQIAELVGQTLPSEGRIEWVAEQSLDALLEYLRLLSFFVSVSDFFQCLHCTVFLLAHCVSERNPREVRFWNLE